MTRLLLIAPGTTVACRTADELVDVLAAATRAGLSVERGTGFAVRILPSPDPARLASQLATERARLASAQQDLERAQAELQRLRGEVDDLRRAATRQMRDREDGREEMLSRRSMAALAGRAS